MKLSKVAALILASIASTPAFATLIVDDFYANVLMSAGDSVSGYHDISPPYVVGTPIDSATLTLFFRDDSTTDGSEYAKVFGLDFLPTGAFEVDTGSKTLDVGTFGELQLFFLGSLSYKLTATQGDFYFRGSQLAVQTHSVPEPGTLALLGAGLIGLAIGFRRRTAVAA